MLVRYDIGEKDLRLLRWTVACNLTLWHLLIIIVGGAGSYFSILCFDLLFDRPSFVVILFVTAALFAFTLSC